MCCCTFCDLLLSWMGNIIQLAVIIQYVQKSTVYKAGRRSSPRTRGLYTCKLSFYEQGGLTRKPEIVVCFAVYEFSCEIVSTRNGRSVDNRVLPIFRGHTSPNEYAHRTPTYINSLWCGLALCILRKRPQAKTRNGVLWNSVLLATDSQTNNKKCPL